MTARLAAPRRKRGTFAHGLKRWLYLIHRWIGIGSCLLFAMWFFSGLVMIYVPYPSLQMSERLAHAQPIDWRQVTVAPPMEADGRPPRLIELEMRDAVPVWRVTHWDGTHETVSAAQGVTLPAVDADYAKRVASAFGGAPVAGIEQLERDQWTVAGGFNRHRPLWKVSLADAASTELYVSASTGAVVQDTTRSERFWNWLGSVPHWLYPTVVRQDNELWRQVVMWVSGPCIAAAVTGMWIGILRTRLGKRRFKGGRTTPYHGWMLWHHVAGLVGGVALTAWIFSGWLSVDPGHLFAGSGPDEAGERAYVAGAPMPALGLERLGETAGGARLVRLSDHAGVPLVSIYAADGSRRVLDVARLAPDKPALARIERAAAGLVPAGHLIEARLLTEPDAYWYGLGEPPLLPVYRLRFDDPAQTWLHIDPATGEVLQGLDARGRTYRWLFDFLHKWDLNVLMLHRPVWDAVLWALSILGLVTSVSGIWIGWKRLVHKPRAVARPGRTTA